MCRVIASHSLVRAAVSPAKCRSLRDSMMCYRFGTILRCACGSASSEGLRVSWSSEVLSVPPRRAPVVLLHAPIRADGLVQITVNVTVPSCAAVLAPFWGILEASSRRRPRLTVCARVFWFRRSEQRHGARSRGPRVAGLTDRQRS